jgi:hypothetical protein
VRGSTLIFSLQTLLYDRTDRHFFTQIAGAAGIRDDAIRHGTAERNSVHVMLLFHIDDTGCSALPGDV